MIIVRLAGGLGNQLFQYAAGYALAKRAGEPLFVDHRGFRFDAQRTLAIGEFDIDLNLLTPVQRLRYPSILASIRSQELLTLFGWYRESSFGAHDWLRGVGGPLLMDGYFQDERLFHEVRNDLIRMYTPRIVPEDLESTRRSIAEFPSVCIHVRRGDYVSSPAARAVHGVCGVDYYEKAIEDLLCVDPDARLLIFSDDPEWCVKNMPSRCEVVSGEDRSAVGDFYLMGACKHFIISHSTFSWWPAWLSENEETIVVAPDPWFVDRSFVCDPVPDRWRRIKRLGD